MHEGEGSARKVCENCQRHICRGLEARTKVKSSVGLTNTITVRVGLHPGSSLSPYLFDLVMGVLGRGIKEQPL